MLPPTNWLRIQEDSRWRSQRGSWPRFLGMLRLHRQLSGVLGNLWLNVCAWHLAILKPTAIITIIIVIIVTCFWYPRISPNAHARNWRSKRLLPWEAKRIQPLVMNSACSRNASRQGECSYVPLAMYLNASFSGHPSRNQGSFPVVCVHAHNNVFAWVASLFLRLTSLADDFFSRWLL